MRILVAVLSAVALAGCGATDPCAGKAGTCITLRVEGDVSGLDQLQISVDKPAPETRMTAVAPFKLPVEIALDFAGGASGAVNVDVVGLGGGNALGSGSTTITIDGTRAKGTVTLSGGALDFAMVDGATDFAGDDLEESCTMVTACKAGDGCCPSGCNGNTDTDCASVCGNKIVEPGEACDDGNVTNGDGCDVTCHWTGTVSLITGTPGGSTHADDSNGLYARLDGAAAMTSDNASKLFIVGNDATIREVDVTDPANPATSTYSGGPYDFAVTGMTVSTARYQFPTLITYVPASQSLYLYDNSTFREVDTSTGVVSTLSLSPPLANTVTALGRNGATIAFYVQNTGLYQLTTATTYSALALQSVFSAAVTHSTDDCADIVCTATTCYLPCGENVVSIGSSGGTPSSYAGVAGTLVGCVSNTTPVALASAQFTNANRIAVDATGGNLYVSDAGCNTIVKIGTGGGGTAIAISGVAGVPAYQDGANATALFNQPSGIAQLGSTTYVAEAGNDTVRSIGTTMTSTAAGRPHNPIGSTFSSLGLATVNFAQPWQGLASDGTYAYGVDGGLRVLKTALASGDTTQVQPALPGGATALSGVVVLGGKLYLASLANGFFSTSGLDGSNGHPFAGTPGTTSPPQDTTPTQVAIIQPEKIATNGTQIFFTDGSGTLVRVLDPSTGAVTTLAGTNGTTTVMDGTGTGASFARLGAIAADATYVYVADGVYVPPGGPPTCIRRIEIATGKVDTIAGSASVLGHTDAVGIAARFGAISALATDGRSLLVGEGNSSSIRGLGVSSVVRQVVLDGFAVTTMIGVPDEASFRPDTGTAARVDFPISFFYDAMSQSMLFFDQEQFVVGRIK